VAALVPASTGHTSTFTPPVILPVTVKLFEQASGAFAALNALIRVENRFGDDRIGMRVSLDRAEAAASGRAELWTVRQTNAST
jgi:hypothetical protein